MNRSTGAFVRPTFHNFCIAIRRECGGVEQIVINETLRRIALGKAFAGMGGKLIYCKMADDMTPGERGQWGVETLADELKRIREMQARSMPMSQLDMH